MSDSDALLTAPGLEATSVSESASPTCLALVPVQPAKRYEPPLVRGVPPNLVAAVKKHREKPMCYVTFTTPELAQLMLGKPPATVGGVSVLPPRPHNTDECSLVLKWMEGTDLSTDVIQQDFTAFAAAYSGQWVVTGVKKHSAKSMAYVTFLSPTLAQAVLARPPTSVCGALVLPARAHQTDPNSIVLKWNDSVDLSHASIAEDFDMFFTTSGSPQQLMLGAAPGQQRVLGAVTPQQLMLGAPTALQRTLAAAGPQQLMLGASPAQQLAVPIAAPKQLMLGPAVALQRMLGATAPQQPLLGVATALQRTLGAAAPQQPILGAATPLQGTLSAAPKQQCTFGAGAPQQLMPPAAPSSGGAPPLAKAAPLQVMSFEEFLELNPHIATLLEQSGNRQVYEDAWGMNQQYVIQTLRNEGHEIQTRSLNTCGDLVAAAAAGLLKRKADASFVSSAFTAPAMEVATSTSVLPGSMIQANLALANKRLCM